MVTRKIYIVDFNGTVVFFIACRQIILYKHTKRYQFTLYSYLTFVSSSLA